MFLSPDGQVELRVWGSHSALYDDNVWFEDANVSAWYESELADATGATYHLLNEKRGWFVISGIEDGAIYYRKTILGDGCYKVTFTIHYPLELAGTYDPVTEVASRSFRCTP